MAVTIGPKSSLPARFERGKAFSAPPASPAAGFSAAPTGQRSMDTFEPLTNFFIGLDTDTYHDRFKMGRLSLDFTLFHHPPSTSTQLKTSLFFFLFGYRGSSGCIHNLQHCAGRSVPSNFLYLGPPPTQTNSFFLLAPVMGISKVKSSLDCNFPSSNASLALPF